MYSTFAKPIQSRDVQLRAVVPADLEIFYTFECDPVAIQMAAFTSADPTNRFAFDMHWARILASPVVMVRTIIVDGAVAGSIACFQREGAWEVTYWLGQPYWGQGIATTALQAFLPTATGRPLHARIAQDNIASRRVLEKCNFREIGKTRGFAAGRGEEINEVIFKYAPTAPKNENVGRAAEI